MSATAERQLDLTINALARSLRKTLRLAEAESPGGTSRIWAAVEHRAALLKTIVEAAVQFGQRHHAPVQPQVAAQVQVEAEQHLAAGTPANTTHKKVRELKLTVQKPTPKVHPTQTSMAGRGFRVFAAAATQQTNPAAHLLASLTGVAGGSTCGTWT